MKKIVSRVLMLALVSSLVLGLAACGDKKEDEKPVVDTPVVDVETEKEPEVEEEKEPVVVKMDEIVKTMQATYGEAYLPGMELDAETFNMTLGIDNEKASEVYSEFYGAVAPMSTHVDKLFIVKTDDVEGAKKIFTDYMAVQIEDAHQYPMNLTKVENYALYDFNDYVILAILGGYTDEQVEADETKTAEEIEKAQADLEKEFYVAQNGKGKAALEDLFEKGYTAVEEKTETEGDALTETTEEVSETVKEVGEVVGEVAKEVVEETNKVTEETPAEVTDTSADTSVETEVTETPETPEDVPVVEDEKLNSNEDNKVSSGNASGASAE